MSKISLFLDLDGVLNPTPCPVEQLMVHLPQLQRLLAEFWELELVISSSVNSARDLRELKAMFPYEVARRVVGLTPCLPLGELNHRERAILMWLAEHRGPVRSAKWVAIDDSPQWFSPRCPNLFVTDPQVGLDECALDGLRWKLLRMVDPEAEPEPSLLA